MGVLQTFRWGGAFVKSYLGSYLFFENFSKFVVCLFVNISYVECRNEPKIDIISY